MDRRKFLQRMSVGASLAAASPLIGNVVRHTGVNGNGGEHPNDGLALLDAEMSHGFVHPPESAAPWVYWMWIDVDTTPAAMTYDLEQMKAKGIAGFILYNSRAEPMQATIPRQVLVEKDHQLEYQFVHNGEYTGGYYPSVSLPPLQAWTPLWRERIRYVAKESARLGLKFCLASGLSGTTGPIAAEYSNQKLIWTETVVSGPVAFDGILPAINNPTNKFTSVHEAELRARRDVAVLAIPDGAGFQASQVIDLTSKMNADGHLLWQAPAGSWKVLRFSQIPTGKTNRWGYYSDAMSAEATDHLWSVTTAPVLAEMSPEERKGLIGIEDDSWEGGDFTWTKRFPEEFKQRRGYDLLAYLPILAGADMADAITREQVQRDYKLTISDLMADYHYGHLEKLCKENGLIFYSEAAGPNLHVVDLLQNLSRVDFPMAEFWMPSFHRPTPRSRFWARNGACASHIYGMPINMDEAFTSMGPAWEESLFDMKAVGDQAFCDGVNRICVHQFSHSPSLTAKPGYVYVPGTHYDPRVTWWEQTPAFNTYMARCSYLLQQGIFVADAIFYKGDNLGDGEQMKVIHPTLGYGYDYDCSNADVLLTRMSVKDGRIVLPDGMSYRILILPDDQPIVLNALQKIARLIEAGATVVGPPPTGLAGLASPEAERQFDSLVAQLWGSATVKRRIGAGHLISGQSASQTLDDAGVPPDFEVAGLTDTGAIYWIHRKTKDADIYFVSSHWQPVEKVECTFRVSGRQPELWDPVTGTMRDAVAFRQKDGRTIVPLEFDPCGSVFVVFRRPIHVTAAGKASTNYPEADVQLTLSGAWEVSFDPKWGGPEKVVFDQLVDWTTRPEPGIKYYSGTAIYKKRFELIKSSIKGERLTLDLGELHEVSSVRLNGRDLGVIWTKPARVDITDALLPKENHLEVTVVNLWPNRLIGDEGLPKEARLTETNVHKFNAHTPLLPSGLIGPVRVLST